MALVLAGFYFVLVTVGWHPGGPMPVFEPLHDDYLRATTMTFAGIVACQNGDRARCAHGPRIAPAVIFFTNRLLVWEIAPEVVFLAALTRCRLSTTCSGTRRSGRSAPKPARDSSPGRVARCGRRSRLSPSARKAPRKARAYALSTYESDSEKMTDVPVGRPVVDRELESVGVASSLSSSLQHRPICARLLRGGVNGLRS